MIQARWCWWRAATPANLRAFLTVDPVVQMERITAREGEDYAQVFREKWIPLEERYFSTCEVERRCDYRLEG